MNSVKKGSVFLCGTVGPLCQVFDGVDIVILEKQEYFRLLPVVKCGRPVLLSFPFSFPYLRFDVNDEVHLPAGCRSCFIMAALRPVRSSGADGAAAFAELPALPSRSQIRFPFRLETWFFWITDNPCSAQMRSLRCCRALAERKNSTSVSWSRG